MIEVIKNALLVVLLLLCSIEDIRYKKIPNKFTGPAMLAGFVLMTIDGGFIGLKDSFFGFALGFGIFFLPFAIGAMGAGDLKLFAAIGAIKGFSFTVAALLATGLAGGVVVIIYMIYKKSLRLTFMRMIGLIVNPVAKYLYMHGGSGKALKTSQYFESLKSNSESLYIPYAVPIAIGSLLALLGLFKDIFPF